MNDLSPYNDLNSLLLQLAYPLERLVKRLLEQDTTAQLVCKDLPEVVPQCSAPTAYLDDDLLTARQIAAAFGVAEKTLANQRWRGGGWPYVTFGNRIRYRYGDVKHHILSTRRRSTSEIVESANFVGGLK